mgnify:FL=1
MCYILKNHLNIKGFSCDSICITKYVYDRNQEFFEYVVKGKFDYKVTTRNNNKISKFWYRLNSEIEEFNNNPRDYKNIKAKIKETMASL